MQGKEQVTSRCEIYLTARGCICRDAILEPEGRRGKLR